MGSRSPKSSSTSATSRSEFAQGDRGRKAHEDDPLHRTFPHLRLRARRPPPVDRRSGAHAGPRADRWRQEEEGRREGRGSARYFLNRSAFSTTSDPAATFTVTFLFTPSWGFLSRKVAF